MKVKELLEHLDGAGLTVTDWGEMPPYLAQVGLTLETNLNEVQWTDCESVEERAVGILTDAGIDAHLEHTGGGIWVAEILSTEIADRIVWVVDSEGDEAGPFLIVAYPRRRAEDCIDELSGACEESDLLDRTIRALSVRPPSGGPNENPGQVPRGHADAR